MSSDWQFGWSRSGHGSFSGNVTFSSRTEQLSFVLVQLDLDLIIADGHIAPDHFQQLLLQFREVVWLIPCCAHAPR